MTKTKLFLILNGIAACGGVYDCFYWRGKQGGFPVFTVYGSIAACIVDFLICLCLFFRTRRKSKQVSKEWGILSLLLISPWG